jgi:penicillin-binding protein-related factor A (putative recombinase)
VDLSEKEIQNSILDFLEYWLIKTGKVGFFWTNNNVGVYDPAKKSYRINRSRHHMNGVSDILGILQGRFVAIEVKNKIGRLSPEQRQFINKINVSGGLAFMARSIEDVERELQNGESKQECKETKSEEKS